MATYQASGPTALAEPIPTASTRTAINTFGGLVLVLFLLSTTRWGSYILPGPPYLADLGVGLLIIDRLLALPLPGRSLPAIDTWTGAAVGAMLLVTFVAVCFGPLNVEAFRDAVPYLYGVMVFLAPPLPTKNVPLARKLITACFAFHLAWTTFSLLVPSIETKYAMPGNSTVDFLSTRTDVDGLVNGLAASIGLYRVLRGDGGIVFFVWGLILVLVSHSRISLVSTVIATALVAAYVAADSGFRDQARGRVVRLADDATRLISDNRPRVFLATAASLVVLAIVGLVVAPTSFERLKNTFGGSSSISVEKGAQASGTTEARLEAWATLTAWITKTETRAVLGSGFGSNIMLDSGAGVVLVHTVDPSLRAPHNFLLGTWAHLGLLGLLIMLGIFGRGFVLAVAVRRLPLNEIDVLAALVVVTIPIAAIAGVLMESPFGAIPFFWGLGHLGSVYKTHPSVRPRAR